MGRVVNFICDTCGKEAKGSILPRGWVETSFYDKIHARWHRYSLCSYDCLARWAGKQSRIFNHLTETASEEEDNAVSMVKER